MCNDVTLEYLDHLIKDEKSKTRREVDKTTLQALENDKRRYKEFAKAIEQETQTGG